MCDPSARTYCRPCLSAGLIEQSVTGDCNAQSEARPHVKGGEKLGDEALNRPLAHLLILGDLLVGKSFSEQARNLSFLIGQMRNIERGMQSLEELLGNLGAGQEKARGEQGREDRRQIAGSEVVPEQMPHNLKLFLVPHIRSPQPRPDND